MREGHPECLCIRCENDSPVNGKSDPCCFRDLGKCGITRCEDFKEDKAAEVKTNGDRLRAMPDEGLASFMFKMGWTLNNYRNGKRCAHCKWDNCESCLEDWLKEEAEA